MNHTTLAVVVAYRLLDERVVTWILLREGPLVPDSDVGINNGISSRYSDQTTWVVSLWAAIQLEPPRPCLVILVTQTIVLLVSFENTFAVRRGVLLTLSSHCLIVTTSSHLEPLLLPDDVPVTIGLTVDIAVVLCQRPSLNQRTLVNRHVAARDVG